MRDFVFKIYKNLGGSRTPDPHSGRGDICSHPPPCHPARCWCPSASSRLATALLHSTTQLLSNHDYVMIIALDFSKAFDTIRRHDLPTLHCLINLPILKSQITSITGLSSSSKHTSTVQDGHRTSALREIPASIVQGSAIGPTSYVVTASDLTTKITGNLLCKYADDTQ